MESLKIIAKSFYVIIFFIIFFLNMTSVAVAQEETVCAVYFTGIGCPHCAKADPFVLPKMPSLYNMIIIEYEIYQTAQNAALIYDYDEKYNTGLGIPLVIFGNESSIRGDTTILEKIEQKIEESNGNPCLLLSGPTKFEELDFASLDGQPKIWGDKRILYSSDMERKEVPFLGDLLATDNIVETIQNFDYEKSGSVSAQLSGSFVNFENSIKIDGWVFAWNGEAVPDLNNTTTEINNIPENASNNETQEIFPLDMKEENNLSIFKILSLAAVDAINPCALAVLTLMLIAIITYNPKNKKKILLAGLAFTCSVFVIYLVYGLVLIKFFQLIQVLTSVRVVLYKILGAAAIILGLLNLKDFFVYKEGGLATEMPLSWRPKIKKILSGVTSPKGAFVVGAFVTLFLLPCTIGPYVIASGILSVLNIIKTLPWLAVYNFIFVLPMIIITLLVYLGFARVEDVSGWKDKNIRYLHLVTGSIMFLLGLAMLFGWV